MAQILGLQILCAGFLLLTGAGRGCEGATASASVPASSAALLSDSESYHEKCADFKCPELPECPDDSEASDSREPFYILTELPFSHDRERAKRDLQTDLQAECCYQPQCRCNKCPEQPQCENEQVLIELSAASGQPGNCCPQFECGKEPQCEAGNKNLTYWLNRCTKCNSCQVPPCQDVCYQADPPHNCMSDEKQLMYNGDTWLEGCIECKCIDGEKQCIAPKDRQLCDSDEQFVEKSTTTSKTPTTSTPSTTTSLTTDAAVVKETSSSIEMSLEEIELKTSSEQPIVKPELKSGAEESIDIPEIVETESELKQPSVESELKPSVETSPKSESVGTQLKAAELELLAGNTITSNSSTNDDLDETTTSAMESENTDKLPLDNTETPLSKEKDTELNIASTADFSSSTSSTLQQEIETEDSIEESTETALDNLELDSTLSTTESTFASAASSSAPDSTTNASSSAASSTLPDSTTKTTSTAASSASPDSTTNTSSSAASSASPDSTTNSSSSAASSASPDSTTNSSSSAASSASPDSNTDTASSPSTLTTESPVALATSSPAPLTPESTSFHRDADILDADYRLASANPNDAGKHPTNLHNLLKFILFIFVVLIACIVLMAFIYIYLRRRKSMYSKVVQSDSNLSENTHTSDLVLDIDTDDTDLPQKQQLKEFVE